MSRVIDILDQLCTRYPALAPCRADIDAAFRALVESWSAGGKLLVCGNGGSAADADHIVGELMKGFMSRRPLPAEVQARLRATDPRLGPELAQKLQGALPGHQPRRRRGAFHRVRQRREW